MHPADLRWRAARAATEPGAQFRDQIGWANLNLVGSLRSQGHRRSGAEGSEGVLATEGSDSLRRRGESAGVSAYLW